MHAAGSAVLTGDGRSLLVAAGGPPSPQDPANLPGGVALLRRDPRTGGLRRPGGARGCVTASGRFGCATGTLTNGAAALALSRDDRSLYAAVNFGTAVFRITP